MRLLFLILFFTNELNAQQIINYGSFESDYHGESSVFFMKESNDEFLYLSRSYGSFDIDFGDETLIPIIGEYGEFDYVLTKTDIHDSIHWYSRWKFGNDWQNSEVCSVNICCDGSIYLSGYCGDSVDFDPGPASFIVESTHNLNFFILKLNSSGELDWVKTGFGLINSSRLNAVIDEEDNLTVFTSYSDTLDCSAFFGDTLINDAAIGTNSLFLMKLSPTGEVFWHKEFGAIGYNHPVSIFEVNSELKLTSLISDSIELSINGVTELLIPNTQMFSSLKMTLNGNGEFTNASLLNNQLIFEIQKEAFDQYGNHYCYALIGDTIFTTTSGQQINLNNIGHYCLLKMNTSNQIEWLYSYPFNLTVTHLQVLNNGSCWASGYFHDTIDFNPSQGTAIEVFNQLPAATDAGFFQVLDNNGQYKSHTVFNLEDGGVPSCNVYSNNNRIALTVNYLDSVKPNGTILPVFYGGMGNVIYLLDDIATNVVPESEMVIAPNPFTDEIGVYLDNSYDQVTVELFDLSGKRLYSLEYLNIQSCHLSIDLAGSLYLLRVKTPDWEKSVRLIKH